MLNFVKIGQKVVKISRFFDSVAILDFQIPLILTTDELRTVAYLPLGHLGHCLSLWTEKKISHMANVQKNH